ncbi:1,4-dihydroxy-2-naphthoate octaprenyltransferase, partial [Nocardioides sp.]|uniref:1,4-dihydroxy-2-naphthoate octaprenyltransferase n=1 Tax=Nocardioides sp. TaxID=35761 RepID=UPI00286D743E
MATPTDWLAGARPRTLPAAVAPVLAGTGVAAYVDEPVWWKAALALIVSLALQVAVNYANDYSDGIRGTDDDRVGPLRLVGSGLASPGSVRLAAFAAFGVAGVAGLLLAATTAWWLVAVGAVCVLAAWFYTGGDRPYGYLGLGEVM